MTPEALQSLAVISQAPLTSLTRPTGVSQPSHPCSQAPCPQPILDTPFPRTRCYYSGGGYNKPGNVCWVLWTPPPRKKTHTPTASPAVIGREVQPLDSLTLAPALVDPEEVTQAICATPGEETHVSHTLTQGGKTLTLYTTGSWKKLDYPPLAASHHFHF